MSGFVTRWPVLLQESVTPADLHVTAVDDAAVLRWRARACAAYLDRCALLQRVREESLLDWAFADAPYAAAVGLGRPGAVPHLN